MPKREENRPLLLFFAHERSGPARRMESVLAHFARVERDRLSVRKIDVDRRPDLAERFLVADVPTLVVVRDRCVVARHDGRASAPKIAALLEPHLDVREAEARVG